MVRIVRLRILIFEGVAMATEKDFDNSEWSNIGPRLKVWRKKKELTLQELSKIIKVSQGTLSDMENSKSYPAFETLARFHFFFPDETWIRLFFG